MSLSQVPLGDVIKPAPLRRAGSTNYPILSMTMRHGLVDQEQKFKKRVASNDLAQYKVVSRGQLVVGFPIDEGVLAFQSLYASAIVSPAYNIWDLAGSVEVDRSYLQRYLRSPAALNYYASKLRGTTARRRTLPSDVFLALPVPLPSIGEQRRITEVLDRADELRAKRREALAYLDELTRSIVAKALAELERSSYPVRPLGSVVERITVGHVGPTSQFFCEEGIPFLRTGNIGSSEIDLSDLRYITPEFHRRLAKSTLRTGDLLVSRVISDEVRCAIVPPELDGANCANAIIVRPGNAVSGIFVRYLITSPLGQSAFLRRRVGSAQSVVNTQVIQSWQVPVPPLSVQMEFATRISAVESMRARQRANLVELDALFASLQDRAFRGLL